jgi:DNA-binding CsgD family transcriptional regulator/energy-coupling factor transporter ATP-binding protein EcfA2
MLPALIGRSVEVERIKQVLANATVAKGGSVAFTGGPGIGKSRLLKTATELAQREGFEVRTVVGTPSESNLPYAALKALLAADLRSELPATLSAAVGLRATETAPFVIAVAASLVSHLSTKAEQTPLLLVIDDLQWIDPSSAAALSLAASRLLADRVAILFAIRTSAPRPAESPIDLGDVDALALIGLPTHGLGPLSAGESGALLAQLGVSAIRSVELVTRSKGIPLLLTVNANESADTADVTALLSELQFDYLRRMRALTPDGQQLCNLVSVDEGRDICEAILRSAFDVATREAIAAGLIELDVDRVRFTHPLVRSAIESSRHPKDTRAVHSQVAAALIGEDQADRRTLHIAAAADGPDDDAVRLLLEFSDRAKARGAQIEAYRATSRAAELTADPIARLGHRIQSAELLYFSGDPEGGAQIARLVGAEADDPVIVLRAELVAAKASEWTENAEDTVAELARLAAKFEATDPEQAIAALCQSAAMAFLASSVEVGIEHGKRALHLAQGRSDEFNQIVATAHIAWNQFLAARTTEAAESLAPIEPILLAVVEGSESLDALLVAQRFSMQAVMEGNWALANQLTAVSMSRSRRLGFRLSAAMFGCIRGASRWRSGQIEEGLSLTVDELDERLLPPISFAWGSAAAGQIAAVLGREEEAETRIDDALRVAKSIGVPVVIAWALAARAHLRLSAGDAPDAVRLLEEVAHICGSMELREPGFFLWHGDYLDALLTCGQRDTAIVELNKLRDLAEVTGRGWAKGVVLRVDAVLTDDLAMAGQIFAESRQVFMSLGMPFEVARTDLSWGSSQTLFPDKLALAEDAFRSMGAQLWAERAYSLRRTTLSVTRSSAEGHSILTKLTSAESRVALGVGAGKTNREVAEEQHVSVRTVEFHLGSIYRKTSIKNRSALIAHLLG